MHAPRRRLQLAYCMTLHDTDAQMKVSLDVLRRVYDAFQTGGDGAGADDDEYLDANGNLHFINAYEMPLWSWSTERVAFER